MAEREPQEPTLDKWGAEVHPAFGMITAHRVSHSSPGAVLFDSDIKHQHTVVLTIMRASRKRDLNHDWIHPGEAVSEVEMSEAQWASFVSAMNTTGVPCTLRRVADDWGIPDVPYDPRLAHSMRETTEAADRMYDNVREVLERVKEKPTKANLRDLEIAIDNAKPNVEFAGRTLAKHAENVVQRARADIEAIVTHKAAQLGIDPAGMTDALAIGPSEPKALPAADEDADEEVRH